MSLFLRLHDPTLPYTRLQVRQEVTHALVAMMEALWIAPWFAVLLVGARQMPPYGLLAYVIVNILAALWIVRLLDAWGMYESLRQLVFMLVLALIILGSIGVLFPPEAAPPVVQSIGDNVTPVQPVSLPPLLPVLGLLSLVWWRGLRLAIVSLTPTRVAFGMRLGILFYFAAAVFPNAQDVVLASLPPFFFCGLLAVSLSRATVLREFYGHDTTFGARWGMFMALAAVATTLAGFTLAALLAGVDPGVFAQVIQPILAALVFFFTLILTPLFLVIQAIAEALIAGLAQMPVVENLIQTPSTEIPQGDPQQIGEVAEFFQQLQQFFQRFGGLQTCIGVFFVLIVVAVIVLSLRRRQRAALPTDEVREDLEGDTLVGLRQLFRRGWDALNSALNAVGQFGLGRDLFAAWTIRRIYAQMARLAQQEGYPRAPSETPYEYQGTLQNAFPNVRGEIALITEAYVCVHYGELPESDEALQRVIEAWQTLKTFPDAG